MRHKNANGIWKTTRLRHIDLKLISLWRQGTVRIPTLTTVHIYCSESQQTFRKQKSDRHKDSDNPAPAAPNLGPDADYIIPPRHTTSGTSGSPTTASSCVLPSFLSPSVSGCLAASQADKLVIGHRHCESKRCARWTGSTPQGNPGLVHCRVGRFREDERPLKIDRVSTKICHHHWMTWRGKKVLC